MTDFAIYKGDGIIESDTNWLGPVTEEDGRLILENGLSLEPGDIACRDGDTISILSPKTKTIWHPPTEIIQYLGLHEEGHLMFNRRPQWLNDVKFKIFKGGSREEVIIFTTDGPLLLDPFQYIKQEKGTIEVLTEQEAVQTGLPI